MSARRAAIRQTAGQNTQQARLDNVIPIAVTIGCGCELCAESAVVRALRLGSPRQDLEEVLRIVAYMLDLECLTANAGVDAVNGMRDALNAAVDALGHVALS